MSSSAVIRRSFRCLALTAGVALCLSLAYFIAADYYVLRNPPECLSSLNETKCVAEFRFARQSLGAFSASRRTVIRALVNRVQAQVTAALPLFEEIKADMTSRTNYTEIITGECADQAGIALYHLRLADDRLSVGTARGAAVGAADGATDRATGIGTGGGTGDGGGGGMAGVPYWLAAAQRQMRNCMSALNYFTGPSLRCAAGDTLKTVTDQCESLLEAAVALASADVSLSDPATCTEQQQQQGEGTGYEAPAWVDMGLYQQLKALQTRMQAETAAGAGRNADSSVNSSLGGNLVGNLGGSLEGDMGGSVGGVAGGSTGGGHVGGPWLREAGARELTPDAVVGVEEQYTRIQQALDVALSVQETARPFIVFIRAGRYEEKVRVGREGVVLVGEGSDRTIITGNDSVTGGSSTYGSATVAVDRGLFMAVGIRVENTAGPRGKQAVALKASGDRSAFLECAFTGHQDTLCVDSGRQYYSNCFISGFTDFIFGDAAALIDRSTVEMRAGKPTVEITASGRETNTPTGIVIRGCNVTAEEGVREGSFGRPWKSCARVVMIDNYLPESMQAAGWSTWNGDTRGDCVCYAEIGSYGPGAAGTNGTAAGAGASGAAGAAGFAGGSDGAAGRASWAKPGLIPASHPHCPRYFLGRGM
ncbi:hypothetical protein CLOM_g21718 [Closterium sp. NIES-68]|nr:hypothetical protein CLOM_g21718 [Closterium sp. NIES-68]